VGAPGGLRASFDCHNPEILRCRQGLGRTAGARAGAAGGTAGCRPERRSWITHGITRHRGALAPIHDRPAIVPEDVLLDHRPLTRAADLDPGARRVIRDGIALHQRLADVFVHIDPFKIVVDHIMEELDIAAVP